MVVQMQHCGAMATPSDLLTASQAAEAWGVSVHTVRRWARDEKVTTIVLPSGRRRYRRSDVENIITTEAAS